MKATPEIDRRAYELAKGYLPGLNTTGVTQALIEKYLNPLSLNPSNPRQRKNSINAYLVLPRMQT